MLHLLKDGAGLSLHVIGEGVISFLMHRKGFTVSKAGVFPMVGCDSRRFKVGCGWVDSSRRGETRIFQKCSRVEICTIKGGVRKVLATGDGQVSQGEDRASFSWVWSACCR